MKGLKKLALATAVAAAPFAQAEMTAMDDALLGEMTGQAGITIDVDLKMTIDAIKYVDDNGATREALDLNGDGDVTDPDEAAFTGAKGAITAKSLAIGSIDFDNNNALSVAQIRGVTIDADGSKGLSIGFGKIGDMEGNGIDITVDAVLINSGQANLAKHNAGVALGTLNAMGSTSYTAANFKSQALPAILAKMSDETNIGTWAQDAAVVSKIVFSEIPFNDMSEIGGALAIDLAAAKSDAYTAQAANFTGSYADLAALQAAASTGAGDQAEQDAKSDLSLVENDTDFIAKVETKTGAGQVIAQAAKNAAKDSANDSNSSLDDARLANQAGLAGAALQNAAAGAGGNVGSFVVENFRNYIQDDLVGRYNGVFDMALQDSEGNVTGEGNVDKNIGRYVRGELNIAGTGTYDAAGNGADSTGGLAIKGKFGGAIDRAAWIDGDGKGEGAGAEFGVKDLGFFHGVDTAVTEDKPNGDGIADVIEGMHFEMKIDVVDRASSVEDAQVAALHISDMKLTGTIMMGNIYLGGTYTDDLGVKTDLAERSLGSVLIKDIDMSGTSVYVYGH